MMSYIKKGFLLLVLSSLLFVLLPFGYGAEPLCNCQSIDYKFSIRNTNDFSENYNISVDKFSDFISISEESVLVLKGGSKAITVTLDIPCDLTGSHRINVVVEALKSQKTSSIPLNLNLDSCYGYDVKFGEEIPIGSEKSKATFRTFEGNYSLCTGEKAAVPILLTNLGVENEYNFDIDGADWSKLSGKRLKLAKDQRGVVYLSLFPEEDVEGEFEIDFSVVNKVGKVEKTFPLHFGVGECYGVGLDIFENEDEICGCEPKNYEIILENNGRFNETIDFLIEPFYAEVNGGESVRLGPSESRSLNLSFEPPCNELKRTQVKVTGFLESDSAVKMSDELNIGFIPTEKCFRAKIFADKQVTIDYSSELVPFTIKNEGEIVTDYSIDVDGPEWVSPEIESVSLKPGDEVKLNLILGIGGGDVTDVTDGNATEGGAVTEGDYVVRININSKDYSQSKVVILKLREEIPFKNISEFFDKNLGIMLGIIFLVVVSYIFISRNKKKISIIKKNNIIKKIKLNKKNKKLVFRILMAVLFLALIIAVYYLLSLLNVLDGVLHFLFWYQYYIYTLIVVVVVLIPLVMFFVKRKKKKKKKVKEIKKGKLVVKEIKEVKKEEKIEAVKELKKEKVKQIKDTKKKSTGIFKKIIGVVYIVLIAVIIIGALTYSFFQFNEVINEFFVTYLYYIVLGVVLLIIFILMIKYNKKVTKLFLGEENKKKNEGNNKVGSKKKKK